MTWSHLREDGDGRSAHHQWFLNVLPTGECSRRSGVCRESLLICDGLLPEERPRRCSSHMRRWNPAGYAKGETPTASRRRTPLAIRSLRSGSARCGRCGCRVNSLQERLNHLLTCGSGTLAPGWRLLPILAGRRGADGSTPLRGAAADGTPACGQRTEVRREHLGSRR